MARIRGLRRHFTDVIATTPHNQMFSIIEVIIPQSTLIITVVYCFISTYTRGINNFNNGIHNMYDKPPLQLGHRHLTDNFHHPVSFKVWTQIVHAKLYTERKRTNMVINVRPSDPNWLNTNIKKLIRKRKRSYTKYKKTSANSDYEAYKK